MDVRDLISLETVMRDHGLGPNGGLLYCMEALEVNFDWLKAALEALDPDSYFVFDFPGQVELFINHDSVYRLLHRLEKELHLRLVAVHLADSTHCRDANRFISLALLTLQSMMRLECPQINLLSKFDKFDTCSLQEGNQESELPLSFYTECQDLSLLTFKNDPSASLTRAVTELIQDFGLVSFIPLAVEDKECMAFLMQEVDKANGFVFGALTAGNESILATAMTAKNREEYLESMEHKYMKPQ